MSKVKRRATTRPASRKRSPTTKPKRAGVAAVRAALGTAAITGEARTDLPRTGEVDVLELAGAPNLTFVAGVSIDGPWELRSLVINDFQVLHKTVPTSTRRIDVPIPAALGSPLNITWAILAGHLIPSVGTFVEPQGQQAVLLAKGR
jgi:hypothetical protein